MIDLKGHTNAQDLKRRRNLDSSDVETDMSPISIQKRLETLGQLSKLANYLSKGTVIGTVEEQRDSFRPE